MANLSLVFDILARDNASKAFRDVGDAAENAGKSGEGFGSRLSTGMKVAGAAIAGAGIIEGFKSLYDAAVESAKVSARTANVLQTTGGVAGVTAKQVGDLATALSNKTGVDDEAIQSGENLLLTFTNIRNEAGKGNDVFNQATSIINDMSAALGQDMSASAIQVGKALNDPIKGVTALTRVGVSFTESQKEQIQTLVESGRTMDAQKIILAELSKEFGGAAEAAATPFGKLQVQLGNLAEQVGSFLIPVVDDVSKFFSRDLLPALSDVADVAGPILGSALSGLGDTLHTVFSVGRDVLGFFEDLPGPVQAGVGALGAMAILKGPLGDLLGTLKGFGSGLGSSIGGTFSAFSEALGYARANGDGLVQVLGSVGSTAGSAIKGGLTNLMNFFGGPWAIALTGATVGIGFFIKALMDANGPTKEQQRQAQLTADAERDFASAIRESSGAIDENVRRSAAKAAQDAGLLDVAEKTGASLSDVTDALLGNDGAYQRVMGSIDGYIAVESALGAEVGKSNEQHLANVRAAEAQKQALEQLAGTLPDNIGKEQQLAEATGEQSDATDGATFAQQQFAQQLQDTADAASDGRKEIDLLKTSLDVLTGDHVSLLEAQSALNDAIAAGTDALKDEGGAVTDASGALETHTENGRAAADVLLDIRNRGNDLIATMIQQGATTDDVTRADQDLRNSFIKTAEQMGISADDANRLADQILGIPASRTTTITADTGEAQRTIDNLVKGINSQGLIGIIRTIGGKADGGIITGPGTGRSDTAGVFALSNGEFVVNAAATAKHRPFLEAINSGIRGLADGGYINYPSDADFLAQVDMTSATKGKLQSALSGGGAVGSGVQRWSGLVSQVLGILGQPLALVGRVLQLIQHESGGNPNAINLWDSNAKRGTPSIGLMQTIGPTFNAYAGPYRNLGIYNPLANVYAGLNYGIHRYGSVMNIPGIRSLAAGGGYRPYDSGGLLMPGLTLAYNGTGKPETVRTAEQEAALGGGGPVVLQLDAAATTALLRGEAVTVVTSFAAAGNQRTQYSAAR